MDIRVMKKPFIVEFGTTTAEKHMWVIVTYDEKTAGEIFERHLRDLKEVEAYDLIDRVRGWAVYSVGGMIDLDHGTIIYDFT